MGWNLYALPALLTPFAITWLICAIASAEHFINIKQASFQGVYIRALLIFPLTSCLAIIGGIDKSITPWMEVLIGMIEGYVLILFMGLYIGWGWTQGDVHKVLLDFERTKYPCYMCCRSWGSGTFTYRFSQRLQHSNQLRLISHREQNFQNFFQHFTAYMS
mmetsp:Transcript_33977/g.41907  ORF Transcript_33977/g.41907 Transcript_33977/m.41907 type:complete len:161 (+) Transcript_33977:421-903(+)